MSACMNAAFLRREEVPRRRMGDECVVCGRKRVKGSSGVCDGGVVR